MHTAPSAPKRLEITYDSSIAEQQQRKSPLGIIPTAVLQLLLKRVSSYPPSLAACARTCRKFYHFAMPFVREVPRSTLHLVTSRILHAASTQNEEVWKAINSVKKMLFGLSPDSGKIDSIHVKNLIRELSERAQNRSHNLTTSVTQCAYSFLPTPEFRKEYCSLLLQQNLQQFQLQRLKKIATSQAYSDVRNSKIKFLKKEEFLRKYVAQMPSEDQRSQFKEYKLLLHALKENPYQAHPETWTEICDLVEEFRIEPEMTKEIETAIEQVVARCATIELRKEFSFARYSSQNNEVTSLFTNQLHVDDRAQSARKKLDGLEAIAKKLQMIQDDLQTQAIDKKSVVAELDFLKELKTLLLYSLKQLEIGGFYHQVPYCRWLLDFRNTLEDQCTILHHLQNHLLFQAADKAAFAYLRFLQMQVAPTPDAVKRETELLQSATQCLDRWRICTIIQENEYLDTFFLSYKTTLDSFLQTHRPKTQQKG